MCKYSTVLKYSFSSHEEKKSKFLISTSPTRTEMEAITFINSIKSQYKDATHNVYAYIINGNTIIQRYSDDKEPKGTAGLPILETIKKNNLKNIVIVVTRYFGGTMLGAAGLVRAYGKSASIGINSSQIIEKFLCKKISIKIDYSFYGKINTELLNNNIYISNTKFQDDVAILIFIPQSDVKNILNLVREKTNNKCEINFISEEFIAFSKNGEFLG